MKIYTEKEVENLLEAQRGNSYVAILNATQDKILAAIASSAPEPGQWKENRQGLGKRLYSEIEHLIIQWNCDGYKTAGSLTREIMSLLEKKEEKFSLVNYEGDALWAKRDGDKVVIYDQWESLVDIMTVPKFCEWLDGDIGLTDSEGKTWYWTKEHRDAKPTMAEVLNFLK